MNNKLQNNIFYLINTLNERISQLETNLVKMQEKMDESLAIQRNHLLRVKNHEEVPDDFLLSGRPYNDLSPDRAWRIFQDEGRDFVFLDVSHKDFVMDGRPEEALQIPLEELHLRFNELPNKTTPILIISENGLRSILACDYLVEQGYFNTNNISGGWKFWPAFRVKEVLPQLPSDEQESA